MNFARHLRIRPHRTLCGSAIYRLNITRERTWTTCRKCQSIIIAYHPGVDPQRLFANLQV